MGNSQAKNLKDLIKIYGSQKSDMEISQLLDIPIESVRSLRNNIYSKDIQAAEGSFNENAFDLVSR